MTPSTATLTVDTFFDIALGRPTNAWRQISRWPKGVGSQANKLHSTRPSRSKFPGGHRSRVTPVPIPNTEVKPATADGTAWVTAWESRSLPGLFV